MTEPLEGQVAIVTGGAGFIGRAITRSLAKRGARVVTVEDRDRSSVPKVDFCPELELERARKGFATTSSVVERENRESARTKHGAFDDERSREEDGTRHRCDFYR